MYRSGARSVKAIAGRGGIYPDQRPLHQTSGRRDAFLAQEKYVVTVEDNAVRGGLGDAINKFYLNSGKQIVNIGYREAFIPHGEPRALAKEYGVSAEAIVSAVRGFYARG